MTEPIDQAKELVTNWGNLKKLYEDIETVGGQAKDIEKYARDEVFNKSGFDYELCVLQPLADAMDTLGDVFGDLRTEFDTKWEALATALAMWAKEVGAADDVAQATFLDPYKALS